MIRLEIDDPFEGGSRILTIKIIASNNGIEMKCTKGTLTFAFRDIDSICSALTFLRDTPNAI